MGSVIVGGARTPMGRMLGALKDLEATDLGGHAIKGALEKTGVPAEKVDYVLMGQVIPAGCGQIPARQMSIKGGVSFSVPAVSVNKVCLSGLNTIAQADRLIRDGVAKIVVAGGSESMTNAPHMLLKARHGYKYGPTLAVDALDYDGLSDAFIHGPMGKVTEDHNTAVDKVGRPEQDAYAARSHRLAAAAKDKFAEEIYPITISSRKGEIVIDSDEGARPDTTAEGLGKLRAAFAKDGTITAGNASQISDGAAAVVVMARETAEEMGLPILCEIIAQGEVAGPDNSLQQQPTNAIRQACSRAGIAVEDLDLIEINEAFAAVILACHHDLGLTDEQADSLINVNGGAIALGHPVGMSGTRITLSLALELKRRGGGIGAAASCGGGGMGEALIIKVA